MKTFLLFSLCAALSFSSANAQSDSTLQHHYIGLAASMYSGYGISYRYNFSSAFSMQTTGIVVLDQGYEFNRDLYWNVGLEAQLTLPILRQRINGDKIVYMYGLERIYIFAGGGLDVNDYRYNSYTPNISYNSNETRKWIGALGVGLQFNIFRMLHATTSFAYMYSNKTTSNYPDDQTNFDNSSIVPKEYIGPGIGIGLFFGF